MNIGICIIAYNRVASLKRVLSSVSQAYYDDKVTLVISIDKSENTEVADCATLFTWTQGEKRVIQHPKNLGLREHVLSCGDLLNDFDALIVLEDDVSVAPSFYFYAKRCVERFQEDENIAGISLYNFPFNYHNQQPFSAIPTDSDVYLMQCAQSWGQVWMKRAWFAFKQWYKNHNEEFGDMAHLPHSICSWPKNSWLKYHTRYCIECNKYFVYPYISMSTNNSDAGTHCAKSDTLPQSIMLFGKKTSFILNPSVKYDGFFENELVYKWVEVPREELCVDFYGEKRNREKKRYWLTLSRQPYKVVRAYGLFQKPYEWNIINKILGNSLFLYDTSIGASVPKRSLRESIDILKYLYKLQSIKKVFLMWQTYMSKS